MNNTINKKIILFKNHIIFNPNDYHLDPEKKANALIQYGRSKNLWMTIDPLYYDKSKIVVVFRFSSGGIRDFIRVTFFRVPTIVNNGKEMTIFAEENHDVKSTNLFLIDNAITYIQQTQLLHCFWTRDDCE